MAIVVTGARIDALLAILCELEATALACAVATTSLYAADCRDELPPGACVTIDPCGCLMYLSRTRKTSSATGTFYTHRVRIVICRP